MWCTRWYLPLVLLPFPIAPPFFLGLYLFSTTLHARPCFYCIILLSAMFMSSCYWPPVPLETALTIPWSENVTTFAEALTSLMPDLPADLKPANVPMLDRCWCDLSSASFFEPYNVTKWELSSVLRLKHELEKKMLARKQEAQTSALGSEPEMVVEDEASETESLDEAGSEQRSTVLSSIWDTISVWPFSRKPDTSLNSTSVPAPSLNASSSDRLEHPSADPQSDTVNSASSSSLPTFAPPEEFPLFRQEYDLRPYGFALVVDFGWTTSKS